MNEEKSLWETIGFFCNKEIKKMNQWERWDDLGLGGPGIFQDKRQFCFGVDAVLLADFCKIKPGERILDLCAGNGIIPILLACKTKAAHVTGLELSERNCALFQRSVERNGFQEKICVLQGDVKEIRSLAPGAGADTVTCNPPYMEAGSGLLNERDEVTWARHEVRCTLGDVLDAAAWAVKPGGRVCMIHRPHRMEDVLFGMRRRKLEPKRFRPVYPKPGEKASMILVEAMRGGNPGMVFLPPLTIYDETGHYSNEIDLIYGRITS